MEKVMFFCVFSYRIFQISSSDVSEHNVRLLRFQLNETISLNCNMSGKYEIAWYHQNPDSGQLTFLIFARSSRKMQFQDYENSRMTLHADVGFNKVSLVIRGLTESDSGLYFCGKKSWTSDMHFENPIRLQMEVSDKLTDSEDKANSDVEITEGLTVTERVLTFCGVGLAVLVCFLAIFVAGRNIYYRSWQKGWTAAEHAGLTEQKSPK